MKPHFHTDGHGRMRHYHPEAQKFSPVRPLDWRWRRAVALVESGRNFSRLRDDEQTGLAVAYLRALGRCRRGVPTAGLLARFPDLHAAHLLHQHAGTAALIVQARLLARRTSDQIALVSGLTVSTIESYEGLFFNVRDRLDARDWIVARAIGTTTSDDGILDRGALLKSFAYFGGPDVLRAVAPYVLGEQDPFGPLLDLTTSHGRSEQVARLAVAVHLLPHDAASVKKLLRINTLVLDLERNQLGGRQTAPLLVRNLDKRLDELRQEELSVRPELGKCTSPVKNKAAVYEVA